MNIEYVSKSDPMMIGSYGIRRRKDFFFRPFPLIRGSHSVSSFSKLSYFQRPSPLHQLPPYLLSPHLKFFSLVSLFSCFPVTPFPLSFFLQYILLISPHDMSIPPQLALPSSSSFLTVLPNSTPDVLVSNLVFSCHSHSKPQHFYLCDFHLFHLFFCDCHRLKSIHHCWSYH